MRSRTSHQTSRTRKPVEIDTNPETGRKYTKAELVAKLLPSRSPEELIWRQYLRHTLGELQLRLRNREAYRYPQRVATGSVHSFDFQADVFRGQYRVVSFDDRTGVYTAEYVEPSDGLIEEARAYYLGSAEPYLSWHDPFGPERRRATRQESFDQEIIDRIDRAGQTFQVRFVSAESYAAAF
jgi:hypothetical protein